MHTASLDGLVPLSHLLPGETGCVGDIVGRGDLVHRLREFGFREGVDVEMFRAGNPCIVRLGANKVCLRSDRWLNVLVRPAGSKVAAANS